MRMLVLPAVMAACAACVGGSMAAGTPEPYSVIVCPASKDNVRNGEGDVIALKNGDLFLAYGRWGADIGDFGTAEVWCKASSDGGKTWGGDRVLVPNEGKLTTFSVSLLRLANGEILMSYLTKDSKEDCNIFFRTSKDDCKTWSERRKFEMPAGYSGYTGMNNDRLIQLKDGRVLAAAWEGHAKGRIIIAFTLYSDDNGQTWRKSNDVDMRVLKADDKVGAQEPAVVELKDGRVMMLIRNSLGCIARSYSTDRGETWSKPELVKELEAPVSPASILRLPQTGDLLLVWNKNPKVRNPLNSAISCDDGKTWEHIRVVDDQPDGPPWPGLAYTSITPVGDNVILTYWYHQPEGISLKLKIFDYRWFYDK